MAGKTDKRIQKVYTTAAFRLSYPALFEPAAVMGNENKKKYTVTMLFPKKAKAAEFASKNHPAKTWMPTDNLLGMYNEILSIARANYGPEVDLRGLKLPKFRDGDKPKDSGKTDENESGYIVLKATSDNKPDCLRADKTRITDPAELYPGCWVRGLLTIAPFNWQGKKGVTLYLAGIQKLADDTAFSSRPRAEDEFDAVGAEGGTAPGEGSSDVPDFMQG